MAISSVRIIRILKENGFTLCRVKGSHHHYKKDGVPGLVTVPHPKRGHSVGNRPKHRTAERYSDPTVAIEPAV